MQKLFEGLEARTLFAAGTPDQFFGSDGSTKIPEISASQNPNPSGTVTTYFYPSQVLTDAAGRVLTATIDSGYSMSITRLGTNGKPDTTFAPHSHNQVIVLDQDNGGPLKMAVDPSNRIYVINGTLISRYRSNGALDTTFGKNGSVSLTALGAGKQKGEGGFDYPVDFLVDSQSRVWIASQVYSTNTKSLTTVMEVMRLTLSGTLDKSFMNGGIYTVPTPGPGTYTNRSVLTRAMKLLSDGSVVVVGDASMNQPTTGFNSSGVEVAKFTSAGALDSTYGDGGLTVYRINAQANAHGQDDGLAGEFALLGNDGSVILKTTGLPSPIRLNADGKTTANVDIYDGNGLPVGIAPIATETDGSKWVWDDYSTLSDFHDEYLYHLMADGTIDPNFNAGHPLKGVTSATVANDGTILYTLGTSPHPNIQDPAPPTGPVVGRLFADEGPVAEYVGGVLATSSKDYLFSLTWQDDDGLNLSTLDSNDVYLRAHGFTGRGRVASVQQQSDGSVVVTYAVRGPNNRWTAANDGPFTLSVQNNSVKDSAGNFATSRPIGILMVAIA